MRDGVTVERIAADGTWQGGAIAPGLGSPVAALHRSTAQLPEVAVAQAPEPWGRSTVPALEAGVFWGAVGAIRELLDAAGRGPRPAPWLVWTGGDAPLLAPRVEWPAARIVPDLVLDGAGPGGVRGAWTMSAEASLAVLTPEGRGAVAVVRRLGAGGARGRRCRLPALRGASAWRSRGRAGSGSAGSGRARG